jgi:hypothetical protein
MIRGRLSRARAAEIAYWVAEAIDAGMEECALVESVLMLRFPNATLPHTRDMARGFIRAGIRRAAKTGLIVKVGRGKWRRP